METQNKMERALRHSCEDERIRIRGNYGGLEVNLDIPNKAKKDCYAFYQEKTADLAVLVANESLAGVEYYKACSAFFDNEAPIVYGKLMPHSAGFTFYGSDLPILSKYGLKNTSMNSDGQGNTPHFYASMNGLLGSMISGKINTALFDRPENRVLDFELESGTENNPYVISRDSSGKLLVFARDKKRFPNHENLIAECERIYGPISKVLRGLVDKAFVKNKEICAKLRFHNGAEDSRVAMLVEHQVAAEFVVYWERMLGYY